MKIKKNQLSSAGLSQEMPIAYVGRSEVIYITKSGGGKWRFTKDKLEFMGSVHSFRAGCAAVRIETTYVNLRLSELKTYAKIFNVNDEKETNPISVTAYKEDIDLSPCGILDIGNSNSSISPCLSGFCCGGC